MLFGKRKGKSLSLAATPSSEPMYCIVGILAGAEEETVEENVLNVDRERNIGIHGAQGMLTN